MSTPYCRGGRVISLQMGSAVSQLLLPKATDLQPVCQRAHWIIHIMRLLLHLLSRCGGVGVSGEGAHLVIWDLCHTCTTTYTFNLPVSTVICFANIEIQLCLQSSYLALSRADGSLFSSRGMALFSARGLHKSGFFTLGNVSCPIPILWQKKNEFFPCPCVSSSYFKRLFRQWLWFDVVTIL